MSVADRRARFRELHAEDRLFLMPNPWDVGSARLLETLGFEALATTSAGFAWALGKMDQEVTRDELVAHVAALCAAITVSLNVDSERLYPDDPGGVAETVRMLGSAGASGCSIEDYDPAAGGMDTVEVAAGRVAEAAEATRALGMVYHRAGQNHIRGVDDLDDTIARLVAYREAGADCVLRRGSPTSSRSDAWSTRSGRRSTCSPCPTGPAIGELDAVGVRRISTGSLLAGAALPARWSRARPSCTTRARRSTPPGTWPATRSPERSWS